MARYEISVAICTYQRLDLLKDALAALFRQEMAMQIAWEIIVVDNDSHGSARELCQDAAAKCPVPLKYVLEKKQGLSQARNRAVEEAQGEIIAFLDDDAVASSPWLKEMLGTFNRTGADCVGGRVLVRWEGSPECGVRGCRKELLEFDQGEDDFAIKARQISPIGANVAFRTAIFESGIRFLVDLGRNGTRLMGGEEVEIINGLHKSGKMVWYGARSVVFHRTAGERLTEGYYIKREKWNGISLALVDKKQLSRTYCFFKAWARILQVYLMFLPQQYLHSMLGNSRKQFLSTCSISKYSNYWKTMMGVNGEVIDV